MRKLVVADYVTIDGVMQDPGGVGEIPLGGWSNAYFNDELAKQQFDLLFASDALVLGRKTFDGFAAAWPSMEATEGEFAVRMNSMPKYVASRSHKGPLPWNGTLLRDDLAGHITELKRQAGKDLLVYGSGELIETLSRHRLVDEYRLMIFPVAVGQGKHLFRDGGPKTEFELADMQRTSTGVVTLTYRRR